MSDETYHFAAPGYAYAYGDFGRPAAALLDFMGESSFQHVMDEYAALSCLPSSRPGQPKVSVPTACTDAVAREDAKLGARSRQG